MEGFTYNNIFETKGIEYLVIIAFLVFIIPFWVFINSKIRIKLSTSRSGSLSSSGILKAPQGIFFNKNHTWTFLEKSGNARVGIDEFLFHVTGKVSLSKIRVPGEIIKKGDLLVEIVQKNNSLLLFSPLSGTIIRSNVELNGNPEIMTEDPYGEGWIYKIKPSVWIAETASCHLADDTVEWLKNEMVRLRDFIAGAVNRYSPEASVLILQDGGEIRDQPLVELPAEVWQEFQKSFLN